MSSSHPDFFYTFVSMKKLFFVIIILITITNISYASFPVTDDFNYVSLVPLDDAFKALLWGVLSIPFCAFIFPSVLAIKYGVSGWNDRNYIASRIGFFLGVIELLIVLVLLILFLLAMPVGAAFGG